MRRGPSPTPPPTGPRSLPARWLSSGELISGLDVHHCLERRQVEYQGVRSDPLEVAMAAAPPLFTVNMKRSGQAAIENQDGRTQNSTDAPARPGGVVVLWGTGEGVTDPPEIGGLPAVIEYCAAAPFNMPGLFQVNARLDAAVAPGDAVPVRVAIGGRPNQSGVTSAHLCVSAVSFFFRCGYAAQQPRSASSVISSVCSRL